MSTRPATAADVAAIADLHRRVFPTYESTRLGRRFCRRLIAAYARHQDATVLVHVGTAGAIDGYLVGGQATVQRQVNRSLLPYAALAFAGRLPTSSVRGIGAARARLASSRRGVGGPAATPDGPVSDRAGGAPSPVGAPAERVILVGVSPDTRGSGAGAALLDAFAAWALDRGAAGLELVVGVDNDSARRAYERNGWYPLDEGPQAASLVYRRDLGPGPAEATEVP